MIKINLLSPERKEIPGAGPETPSFSDEKKAAKLSVPSAIIAAILTIGVIGFLYYTQNQAIDNLQTELTDKENQKTSLKDVEENLKKLEKAKADVLQKMTLITDLKKMQSHTVKMMDETCNSLPEWVWITNLQFTGSRLTLTGKAIHNNLIADFINNLKATGSFRDIDFKNSNKSAEAGQDIFTFNLLCNYQDKVQAQDKDKVSVIK